MFTKKRKGLKEIAICITYATLLLQTQAMEEGLNEKLTTIKLAEKRCWQDLTYAENTGKNIKRAIENLETVISERVRLKKHLEELTLQKSNSFIEDKKYNIVGIALFSGADFVSNFVKYSTNSTVSHVGIILSDQKDENQWYCFESTGSEREVLNGEYPHVRLTPWKKVVNEYEGTVNYRLFVFQNGERTNPDWVTGFVKDYDGKSYTKNPLKLLRALFGTNTHSNSPTLKTVFCSELAAQMLIDCKITPLGIATGNYLPKHFLSEKQLRLEPGIELTPEFPAPKDEDLNIK